MTINLLQLGLEIQAASLGKGTLAKVIPANEPEGSSHRGAAKAADYRPLEKVCPSCGAKYVGNSCPRSACSQGD